MIKYTCDACGGEGIEPVRSEPRETTNDPPRLTLSVGFTTKAIKPDICHKCFFEEAQRLLDQARARELH